MQNLRGSVSSLASVAEAQREWILSVIVNGREELSPAQTEASNTISASNTIVVFSGAEAIMLDPVWRAHSVHGPQSQTFGPTLHVIFDVDKYTQLSRVRCGPTGGETYCCFSVNWHEQSQ